MPVGNPVGSPVAGELTQVTDRLGRHEVRLQQPGLGELARVGLARPDDLGDLRVAVVEDVAQQERRALLGASASSKTRNASESAVDSRSLSEHRSLMTTVTRGGAMETMIARCCGLDVHEARVSACVRVLVDRTVSELIETFGTTTSDLLALRDWLAAHAVTHVAMESTGVYWKCVYYVLEDDFEVLLVNAREWSEDLCSHERTGVSCLRTHAAGAGP